jgi:hypothetical protein
VNQLDQEKLFYERFWTLHSDLQLVEVFKRFGWEAFRRSSVLEGFQQALRRFELKGRRCLEIGTCNGLTAIVLSRFFDEVVSIDIMPSRLKHEIVDFLQITNVRFHDVKDDSEKAHLIYAYNFDLAYVDGNHDQDTLFDFDLVKRCGRVLFHEYWEAQPPVWNLINSLRSSGRVRTEGKLALWEEMNGRANPAV